jgi:hypothetical protein
MGVAGGKTNQGWRRWEKSAGNAGYPDRSQQVAYGQHCDGRGSPPPMALASTVEVRFLVVESW